VFVDCSWRYDGIAGPDSGTLVVGLPDGDDCAELPLPELIGVGVVGGGGVEVAGGNGSEVMSEPLLLVWVIVDSYEFFAG
jgi:hypothetical protein